MGNLFKNQEYEDFKMLLSLEKCNNYNLIDSIKISVNVCKIRPDTFTQ